MSGNGITPPGGDDNNTGKEVEGTVPTGPREDPEQEVASSPETPTAGAGPAEPVEAPESPPVETPESPPVEAPPPSAPASSDDSAEALIREYQAVVRWNSLIRVIFPVFVLALIAVFILVTVLGIMSAFPEKRITQETVKAGHEILPILNKILRSFVDEVAPQLAEEFERGLEEGTERITQSLAQELERLQAGTADKIKIKVHDAIELERKNHKALLLELYPELKDDPDRLNELSKRLNKAFEIWTVKYLLGILEDYYLAMAKINDTIIKSYRPKPAAPGEAKRVKETEMLELVMELMNAAYTEEGGAVAPVQPEGREKPAGEVEPAKDSEGTPEVAPEAAAPEGAATEEPAKEAPAAAESTTTENQ